MKNLLIFGSVVLVGLLLTTSCSDNEEFITAVISKEDITSQEVLSETELEVSENIIYMVDNQVVNASSFQWNIEGMTYHINIGEKDNPMSENIYYMAFSDSADYDSFMVSEIGNKYNVHQSIIAHLRNYAQTSGAVDSLEQYGTIPQFYLNYEQRYLQENLPLEAVGMGQQRTLVAVLFKNKRCRNAFNVTIPFLGTPFFIFNNNQASSFEGLLVGGWHVAFDNAFYFNAMISFTTWGLNCINMPTLFDDQTSSWWSIGI